MKLRTVRAKLFVGMGTVIAAFVTLSLIIVTQVADQFGEEEIGRNLQFARNAFQGYMQSRQQLLQDKGRSLADTPYLKATLSLEELDHETAFYLATQLAEVSQTDLLLLVDFEGRLLADAASDERTSGSLLNRPSTELALRGDEGCAFWSYYDEEFLVTTSPVTAGESLLGVLVLGQRIDQNFADHVRQATGRDVLLCLQSECLAQSYADEVMVTASKTTDILQALRQHPADDKAVVRLAASGHTTLYSNLKLGDLTVVLSRRLDDFASLSQRAGGWLMLLGFAVVVIATGVCLGISKRLSQPIAELVQASEAMADGNLSAEVSVRGDDELASLSSSFNTMARQIEQLVTDVQAAADIANSASQAKSNFLANVSHELRTPLNGIIGFNGLLIENATNVEQDAASAQQLEWLDTIDASSQRLLAVVDDILDVARIENQQLEIDRVACNPATVVNEVFAKHEPAATEKGLTLKINSVADLPDTISSDPSRLEQLLSNLVENAIKFTRAGHVTISANLTRHTDNATLILTVKDTGIGIAKNQIDAVFEPFVQADGSMTREFGGTGLGLSISRQIAAALGGSLTVSSEVGKGSTFVCEIDAGPVAAAEKPPEQSALPEFQGDFTRNTITSPAHDAKRESNDQPFDESALEATILVVDDADINRKLVSLILRKSGASVVEATNGQEAVELCFPNDRLQGKKFDLILMDMQMPILDGYAATTELRRRGFRNPVIAITAHAMMGDREKCEAAGCSDYLTKPISPTELVGEITAALKVSEPASPNQ
jgi:signal transduction histidine kinase/ActR/RegA family two-component response regulator